MTSKDDQRRDAVLAHMLSRPPKPHQTLKAQKRKARPHTKGRTQKAKTGAR